MSQTPRHLIIERRKEMVKNIAKGVPLHDLIPDLARKYETTEHALRRDWNRRKQWLPKIVKLEDPISIHEWAEGLKQILPNAWYEYTQADNSSAKVGALRLAKEVYLDLIRIAMELGIKPEIAATEVFTWKEPSWLRDTANMNPTPDSGNSTKAQPDSESSLAEEDGAKPSVAQTRQSNKP